MSARSADHTLDQRGVAPNWAPAFTAMGTPDIPVRSAMSGAPNA
ncbi:hypothetical protein [Rhodococcus rhodnii]|nr:hypothetical protein [Rhodococcus rhodnii]